MPTRTYLAPLLLAGILSACGSLGGSPCVSSYQRPDWARLTTDLNQAQARWNASNIQTYAYTNTVSNFGGQFVTRVDVENDVVLRVRNGQTGALLDTNQASTINQVFASLRDSIARARANSQSCLYLTVTYDTSLGFPARIDSGNLTVGLQDAFGGQDISQLERPSP